MFWFVLVCGWGITAAVVALVWVSVQPRANLGIGLLVGVFAGLLWPVSLWVAVGAWLYDRAMRRHRRVAGWDPSAAVAQASQAEAFAQQAELEGMSASAAYWRAETQRLTAEHHVAATGARRPAATALIVLGCTIAALATVGGVAMVIPSTPPLSATAAPSPLADQAGPPVKQAPAQQQRTKLGNIAKKFGETSSYDVTDTNTAATFVISEPRVARCNPYAKQPLHGRFIELPINVRTGDDPNAMLRFMTFGTSWEYVGVDGRSLDASTSEAASCAFETPSRMGPNRTYEFRVILDVPAEQGVLVLRAPTTAAGWEWPYQP